jgi:tRNA threonylcarbamoyladenosine biosynthesis protein TsaE
MDGTVEFRTDTPDATRDLAGALAAMFRAGDVVSLSGELGAGKTCFVQGAVRALGVTDRVTSPTFVLVRTYPTDPPVVHCDVYRLDTLRDVLDLGEDVAGPDHLTFVEWGDAVAAVLPTDRLDVDIVLADDAGDDEPGRLLRLEGHGRWVARLAEARDRGRAWLVEGR